ncbi:MAG: hypothetical protein R2932_26555 [Caldilineaceae bacterium]
MSQGTFTVGDFALFVAYLWEVTEGLTFLGNMFAVQKQVDVSVHRMARQIENERRANESDFTGAESQGSKREDVGKQGAVPDKTLTVNGIVIEKAGWAAYETLVAPTNVYLDGISPDPLLAQGEDRPVGDTGGAETDLSPSHHRTWHCQY